MRFLIMFLGMFFAVGSYAKDFVISSTAFTDGGRIPLVYTCDGQEISPPLAWVDPPAKTQSFVLIVSDPDAPAGTFYHWVVFNIPGAVRGLDKTLPEGSIVGQNTIGMEAYKGPCPPKGKPHHYIFTLYALDRKMDVSSHVDVDTVMVEMKGHTLQTTQLTGLFGR